ncbi:MAG TPA: acyl carrier protein [Planctomycetes bacterium]|nr:acyl carrier protein [Planctomycetota bacterium]
MSIAVQIREMLEAEKDFKMSPSVSDDDSLIESGVADSFAMITLVVLLERTFSIKVEPEEMSQDVFSSIGRIAGYVEGKLSGNDRD